MRSQADLIYRLRGQRDTRPEVIYIKEDKKMGYNIAIDGPAGAGKTAEEPGPVSAATQGFIRFFEMSKAYEHSWFIG